ncbi:MAG: hypothetical protein ACI828_002563 [Flavobacteriales bacterium]|jgi:hypothetical protein
MGYFDEGIKTDDNDAKTDSNKKIGLGFMG